MVVVDKSEYEEGTGPRVEQALQKTVAAGRWLNRNKAVSVFNKGRQILGENLVAN